MIGALCSRRRKIASFRSSELVGTLLVSSSSSFSPFILLPFSLFLGPSVES